jgi:hypothetical protein
VRRRSLGADAAKAFGKRFVEPQASGLRKRRGFRIAIDLDRLFGGVHDDAAVLAFPEVLFNRRAQNRIEGLVQIIRELADNRFALH